MEVAALKKLSRSDSKLTVIYFESMQHKSIGYGVTANIAASQTDRGSSGFDSPYPNVYFFIDFDILDTQSLFFSSPTNATYFCIPCVHSDIFLPPPII